MSGKNKNYNSIIFLTTLSVYLGLVLVSGSPQVFAYAATNKVFDIQHEIEFRDDLDNKPDSENLADLKTKIDEQDQAFIKEYVNLVSSSITKYYSPKVSDYDFSISLLGEMDKKDFPSLGSHLTGIIDFKADKHALIGKLNLKSISDELSIDKFASKYRADLEFYAQKSVNKTEKVIAENTKVTFENNQIFIITNLPRASIDSLLKQ